MIVTRDELKKSYKELVQHLMDESYKISRYLYNQYKDNPFSHRYDIRADIAKLWASVFIRHQLLQDMKEKLQSNQDQWEINSVPGHQEINS